jgi:hypothetical protein
MRILRRLLLLLVVASSAAPMFADAGVFTGNGQSLHQITSKSIQLVSIDVTMALGRGPYLYDGGVAGMDRARYLCKFVLRSKSDQSEDVEIGFPVDSEFATDNGSALPTESANWVLEYSFIARDENQTYHVEYVHRKPKEGPGEFASLFTWKMRFRPQETRALTVSYEMPISMGLVTTEKDQDGSHNLNSRQPEFGVFQMETLDLGIMEQAGYITSTGSSWADNVQSATFTVYTEAFENYLNYRGVIEASPSKATSDGTEERENPFPVQHPWWFRTVSPDHWMAVKGGIQWKYENYKPQAPLTVRYYMTEFPQSPADVDAFANRILKRLGKSESQLAALTEAKEILLATYGKEPTDPDARRYVERQLWYTPQKDFSVSSLNPTQKATVEALDARIFNLPKAAQTGKSKKANQQ